MSSKDKESKGLPEKLKQFFRLNKNAGVPKRNDFVINQEIEKEISADSPLNHRLKVIRELSDSVLANHLEDKMIEKLWFCVQDLLSEHHARETRHVTFGFIQCLVRGQPDKLGMLRAHFFRLIKKNSPAEDVVPRFELLQSLTENGKYILHFEDEIGPFLQQWMPEVTAAGKTQDFLYLLVNVVKFNAAYIDEDVIAEFVKNTSLLCCSASQQAVVMACLQVLDAVVCYSILPNDSLPTFIAALCRTVSHEAYCRSSWKIMRNLLGTHLGHAALHTMCRALQEPALSSDPGLLRGAVFHINRGLWGCDRVTQLRCSPSAVLPSFLQVLKNCNHPVVMYEVMLSIQMLVKKQGQELAKKQGQELVKKQIYELQDPCWDNILDIIEEIIKHIENSSQSNSSLVASHLHETLTTIEELMESKHFSGSEQKVFGLIERCASSRPESSVLHLIDYLSKSVVPTRHKWLSKLHLIFEHYFKQETRTKIRITVLEILTNVITVNRAMYEEELVENIVILHLENIASDPDVLVRNTAASLLVNLCLECDTKRCLELLDILDKLLKRPFDIYGETTSPAIEADLLDVNTVVTGLIRVFISKLHVLPSSHSVHVYQMLVSHLEAHYAKPHIFDNSNHIRYKIFECFLKIRANSLYHIGYPDATTGVLRFSPYLCVAPGSGTSTGSPPPSSPAIVPPTQPCVVTPVSLKRGFGAVVTCIKQEKDWEVLHLILQEVPKVMQNKSLILSRQGNTDIDLLATALCNIVTEKSLGLPETLYNTPLKFTRSEFHSHVLPVLASLASYHGYLDSVRQKLLVRCLVKNGLVSRCSRQCITALTTCTLEMRDVMVKLLPEVLLDISKVSATVHISIPILEFLSTLTRLPNVFASFVGDQYMSVFAISLPYTNPFKYNHYTVSLAHHVIAVWFLKCRLPFRKDFVTFITKGLRANVIVPFEEGQINKSSELLNEDSSNRKRSSSLTEQGSRSRRERPPIPPTGRLDTRAALDLRPTIDDALSTFHTELTETCIDLMARYTFSPCSAVPKRLPTAEFLLAGGQSMSWLIGNKLVTITTSGCSQKALKNGLCDKCWAFCKPDSLIISDPDSDFKRYSRSTLNRSGSGEESNRVTRQNSNEVQKSSQDSPIEEKKDITTNLISTEKLELLPSKLHQLLGSDKLEMKPERSLCACWCQGWAEVYVRRPTGDMSWVMRIQNQIGSQSSLVDLPLNEMSTLFLPSLDRRADSERDIKTDESDAETSEYNRSTYSWKTSSVSGPINIPGSPLKQSPSRQNSHESFEEELDADIYENGSKSRNPVRRSNSSPEMSASWKNPFLLQEKIDKMNSGYEYSADDQVGNVPEVGQKKSKNYGKDMRVSCEAIPEEMSGLGTTPPSVEVTEQSQHPQLLSCHSCPAAARENTTVESVKGPVTVPSSPVTLTNVAQNSPYAYSQTDLFKTAVQNQTKKESEVTAKSVEGQKERPSNLSVVNKTGGSPLTTKPPQSPTQTSPRFSRHGSDKESGVKTSTSLMRSVSSTIEKQTKFAQSTEKINVENRTDLLPIRRDRGYTMPVISPIRKPRIRKTNSPHGKEAPKSGISPSFVFLQLYHSSYFGTSDKSNEKPLLISQSTEMQRSLKLLDHIPPYETHKVGVIYVGPGQCNDEAAILRNHFGSLRYVQFLQKLGTLIKLQDADRQTFFLGGLDQSGKDGKFTYIWQDDVIQVTFHVATLMPYEESDHQCNQKKCHIGNDFVTIVYNESGQEYNMQTIKAQFNFACVVIEPLDHGTNRVTVKARDELAEHIGHTEPKIISDQNVALLARQLALHANLASMIARSLKTQGHSPYASNWLERLRCIKRIRSKVIQEISATKEKSGNGNGADNDPLSARPSRRVHMDDFTEYT